MRRCISSPGVAIADSLRLTHCTTCAESTSSHCAAWNTLVTDAGGDLRALSPASGPYVTDDRPGGASLTLHRLLPVARFS
mgnify:CR=1 FL=1